MITITKISTDEGMERVDDPDDLPSHVLRLKARYRRSQMDDGDTAADTWLKESISTSSESERKLICDATTGKEDSTDDDLFAAMKRDAEKHFVVLPNALFLVKRTETEYRHMEDKKEGSPLKRSKMIHVDGASAAASETDDDDDDPMCDFLGTGCTTTETKNSSLSLCRSCAKESYYVVSNGCECCGGDVCHDCHEHDTHKASRKYDLFCEECAQKCDSENDTYWHREPDTIAEEDEAETEPETEDKVDTRHTAESDEEYYADCV